MPKSRLDKLLNQLKLEGTNTVFFRNEKGEFVDALNAENSKKAVLHFETPKKLDLIKPTAIYVFNKQPFILFFDLTDEKDKKREEEIHKKVWSFDNSPVIFVIKPKETIVYNALNYVKKDSCLEKIDITEEDRNKLFSFWNLQSGTTWQRLQNEYLEKSIKKETQKRVNEQLFKNIKDVRKKLVELEMLEQHADSLILRLIFIRYLIDREVEINTNYISGKDTNEKRECFYKLIPQTEKLNQLFEYLNDRFNGVLFKDLDILITPDQAKFLAEVFRGELQKEDSIFKDFFFEIFDFSIIPVELISGIYESLLDKETKDATSAIYTPPFLVDYILNDTVDKYLETSQTSDCKVFEVAVGSGIFLVQSLRRMIEKEKELNGNEDKKKFSEKIREIAENNLYGIDINEEALKVTCFSIYIALLDYQAPKDIDVYQFPNLIGKNLFKANFFDAEKPCFEIIKNAKPNFILGNPPWKKDKSETHLKWLNDNNIYDKKIKGKMEIAQSFLLRAKDFMQADTKAALIVTSTMFYNISSTTKTFKNKFLKTYCLDKFFDLSPVRRLIFEEKDSPASIVYFRLPKNKDENLKNIVNHQSVKINYFLKYFKMLVIEKFDQKEIQQKHFIENDWLFKVALYGNVLDFVLLNKIFLNNKKIGSLIDNKIIFGGAGILKGGQDKKENDENTEDITKNKKKGKIFFDFLTGLPINENSHIKKYFTQNSERILSYEETYLEAGRTSSIFNGSKILFKEQTENETDIVISYNHSPSVYKKGVFGICSLNDEIIRRLYSYLISDLYSYYIFYNAGSWATSTRPQIRWKEEYLSFPIIEPNEQTKTELINLVNQFLKPFEDYYKQETRSESLPINKEILAKINNIINDLYEIKSYEKDLIDYVLSVSRYQFQESKQQQFIKRADLVENLLENYANVYLQEFGKIYDDEFMQVDIYSLNHFIAMDFKFLDSKPKEKIVYSENKEETQVFKFFADKLSISQKTNTENLFIQKDIKGFEENSFYIIKPNEYKCWHRAMAWYDVAEFMEAIQKAELKRLNGNADND